MSDPHATHGHEAPHEGPGPLGHDLHTGLQYQPALPIPNGKTCLWLFLWQFPHFMAIAWLYRADYAAAGHRMWSVVDPTGVRCGMQAVIGAAMLIPVSLIPALNPASGSPMVYGLWAVALGAAQFAFAVRFALQRDEQSARPLLRATLLYLPAWLTMLTLVTV